MSSFFTKCAISAACVYCTKCVYKQKNNSMSISYEDANEYERYGLKREYTGD